MPLLLLLGALIGALSSPAGAQETDEGDEWAEDSWAEESPAAVEFHGFLEAGLGIRVFSDALSEEQETLQELRFRAELSRDFGPVSVSLEADLLGDWLSDHDLELELREALVAFSAGDADFRVGRQVSTWGTGDLLFLNDLFPKDWVSFFAGRETSFLKYPSDSFRVSVFESALNVDVVWTPVFEPDRFVTGERFSYFSPVVGELVAAPPKLDPVEPPRTLENSELALRLYRSFGSKELAFYAYRGFFKQPTGFDAQIGRTIFPPLSVWGASIRGPSWGGISNAEVAFYDSRHDRRGDDAFLPNSQYRLLLGHERELVRRLTLGLQYYLEVLAHHGRLLASLPAAQASTAPDRWRHVVTTRWTYRLLRDELVLSLFAFYSPSDEDWYALPGVGYRISDRWQWDAGLNLFGGSRTHTFFGQFENNSNAYSRLRFLF